MYINLYIIHKSDIHCIFGYPCITNGLLETNLWTTVDNPYKNCIHTCTLYSWISTEKRWLNVYKLVHIHKSDIHCIFGYPCIINGWLETNLWTTVDNPYFNAYPRTMYMYIHSRPHLHPRSHPYKSVLGRKPCIFIFDVEEQVPYHSTTTAASTAASTTTTTATRNATSTTTSWLSWW